MRAPYEMFPFCPLDTTAKPRNWRTFYSHSPVTLATGRSSGVHDCTSAYVDWLMSSRGIDHVEASGVVAAQRNAPSGMIVASFHPDDMATRPAPKTPRNVAAKPAPTPVAAPVVTVPDEYRDIVAALIAGNGAGALAQLQSMLSPHGAMTPSALRRAVVTL